MAGLSACNSEDGAIPRDTPSEEETIGQMRQASALYDNLWPVSSNVIKVPYVLDPHVTRISEKLWTENINRWEDLSVGRIQFARTVLNFTPSSGDYIRFTTHHSNFGICDGGAQRSTLCAIRDSQILGISMLAGQVTTVFADLGSYTVSTMDALQDAKFANYVNVDIPDPPDPDLGNYRSTNIAAMEYQQDSSNTLITWYESDPELAVVGVPYRIWRSKGKLPSLVSSSGATPVNLPAGLDTVFTNSRPGSTLRGVAVRGNTVYSYWNIGSELFVARGSSTSMDSVSGLASVSIPAGKTVDDLIDMSFDELGQLQTYFVESYDSGYSPRVKIPVGARRFVGTFRDLDGASNDAGVVNSTIKTSLPRAALHELGHALGMVHEHQRIDRDDYIAVSDTTDNYVKRSDETYSDYDLASLMHYGNGKVRRLDGSSISAPQTASWHDLAGLFLAYGLPEYTRDDAWVGNDASDSGLGFSPLAGMAATDMIGGEFDRQGDFWSWYQFDGDSTYGSGHEWDLDASRQGALAVETSIAGGTAKVLGVAITKNAQAPFPANTWYSAPTTASCSSGVYLAVGTVLSLGTFFSPKCVIVAGTSYDGNDIVEMAMANFSGTERVYTLYKSGRISVGSPTNLASVTAPTAYAMPLGKRAQDVVAFSILNGTAMFHLSNSRLVRDTQFSDVF